MQVKIYGASDDLIELEGDTSEEFSGGKKPTYLVFSDGTIVEVAYSPDDSGCWRVSVIEKGLASSAKTQVGNDDDDAEGKSDPDAPRYSDVVVISSEVPLTLILKTRNKLKAIQATIKEDVLGIRRTQKIWAVLENHSLLDDLDEEEREQVFEEIQDAIQFIVAGGES